MDLAGLQAICSASPAAFGCGGWRPDGRPPVGLWRRGPHSRQRRPIRSPASAEIVNAGRRRKPSPATVAALGAQVTLVGGRRRVDPSAHEAGGWWRRTRMHGANGRDPDSPDHDQDAVSPDGQKLAGRGKRTVARRRRRTRGVIERRRRAQGAGAILLSDLRQGRRQRPRIEAALMRRKPKVVA